VGFWKKRHIRIRRREKDQRDDEKDGRDAEGGEKVLPVRLANEKANKINASGDFDKWLQKRNLALNPILWEICSNTYSDWKEQDEQYTYGVRSFVKIGTF